MSWDLEFEHRVGVLGWSAPHYLPCCRDSRLGSMDEAGTFSGMNARVLD